MLDDMCRAFYAADRSLQRDGKWIVSSVAWRILQAEIRRSGQFVYDPKTKKVPNKLLGLIVQIDEAQTCAWRLEPDPFAAMFRREPGPDGTTPC